MAKRKEIDIDEYRRGLHLPPEFRDFHDQKDLFKQIGNREINGKEITWVDGHVYTIDFFLWIMAKYGYELRRTKRRVKREDIAEAIRQRREAEAEIFRQMLNGG